MSIGLLNPVDQPVAQNGQQPDQGQQQPGFGGWLQGLLGSIISKPPEPYTMSPELRALHQHPLRVQGFPQEAETETISGWFNALSSYARSRLPEFASKIQLLKNQFLGGSRDALVETERLLSQLHQAEQDAWQAGARWGPRAAQVAGEVDPALILSILPESFWQQILQSTQPPQG